MPFGRNPRRRTTTKDLSSTTTDETPSSNDGFESEDFFADLNQIDELEQGEESLEDDDAPARAAKTVAKLQEQLLSGNGEQVHMSFAPCCVCSGYDRPDSLLLCDHCDDTYHLECIRPELLSLPDYDWRCLLCEHKRLCEILVEKLKQLIDDQERLGGEHRPSSSKRKRGSNDGNTPASDRPRKAMLQKRRARMIISSDEEEEEEAHVEKETSVLVEECRHTNDNQLLPNQHDEHSQESSEKRQLRSCRQRPKDYCYDQFDAKIKEAIVDGGIGTKSVDTDSGTSLDNQRTFTSPGAVGLDATEEYDVEKDQARSSPRYEHDDDYNGSDGRDHDDDGDEGNDETFVVHPTPYIVGSEMKENNKDHSGFSIHNTEYQPEEAQRPSSVSSKRKSNASRPARAARRRSTIRSDEDNIRKYDLLAVRRIL